jgi:hypothetical protein
MYLLTRFSGKIMANLDQDPYTHGRKIQTLYAGKGGELKIYGGLSMII